MNSKRPTSTLIAIGLLALWLAVITPAMFWGLPTSADDPLLFGGEPPWPAWRYQATQAVETLRRGNVGADVDISPLARRDRIVNLTATGAQRAEILRRYRLYSRQPDEMITFRALMRMNPRQLDFDPRLYQYGGTYIYAVGAMIAVGAATGLLHVTSDVGYYLTHPDAFARFYVAARLLTVLFGAGLLIGAARLARRIGGRRAGWIAAVLVAFSPVLLAGVVEAKPHVPAACMTVWAILAAIDLSRRWRRRDALRLGLLSGLAGSLVLSGWAVLAAWAAVAKRGRSDEATKRPSDEGKRAQGAGRRAQRAGGALGLLLLALGVAMGVYVLTNPYVVWHALSDPAALKSNLGNTAGMYRIGALPRGAVRVVRLLVESVGIGVLALAVLSLVPLARGQGRAFWIAAGPAAAMLAVGVAVGAGKPAEFARFLLIPAVLACVAAAGLLGRLAITRPLAAILLTIVLLATMRTRAYVHSFIEDARRVNESRHVAARWIAAHVPPAEPVGVIQEPAPYCVPPIDFAHRTVLWLPPTPPAGLDPRRLPAVLVCTADAPGSYAGAWWQRYYRLERMIPAERKWLSPITWANKLVLIYRRAERGP